MQVIADYFYSMFIAIVAGFEYLKWLVSGAVNLGGMMNKAIEMITVVLHFFPASVSASLVSMLGGLVVLRIFGRS